jgi:hypothetical protein
MPVDRGEFPLTQPIQTDAYIIFLGLLSIPILYPYGNLKAIDAYFFGASASTESGLNTLVDGTLRLSPKRLTWNS